VENINVTYISKINTFVVYNVSASSLSKEQAHDLAENIRQMTGSSIIIIYGNFIAK